MELNKKKSFPKLSKKLKGFVTDESGKISKRDALGLSAGAVLLGGVEESFANICNHSNSFSGWATRYSAGGSVTAIGAPISGINTSHVNGSVNGHMSVTPNGGGYSGYLPGGTYTTLGSGVASFTGHGNSVSHSNHASHASHASSGSGDSGDSGDSGSGDSGDY